MYRHTHKTLTLLFFAMLTVATMAQMFATDLFVGRETTPLPLRGGVGGGASGVGLDTLVVGEPLKLYVPDTTDKRPVYPFVALARSYKDKIVVRWATNNFVPWTVCSSAGYMIVRVDMQPDGEWKTDTIAPCVRAHTLQQFMDKFGKEDSIAGMAAQLLYGKGTSLSGKEATRNAMFEVYDEQQSRYADALMVAEFRPDLAEAMALRYEDHDVVEGHTYEYYIKPLVTDAELRVEQAMTQIECRPYKPEPYNPVMTDSLTGGGRGVDLVWPYTDEFSAFDVERREVGKTDWVRLNKNPFIAVSTGEELLANNVFSDPNVLMGHTYEYRVRGYDMFGEKSPYSPVHQVFVADRLAPRPPVINYFELHRNDDDTDIKADIHWTKDTLEADFVGYNIYYFHRSRGREWQKLNDEMISRYATTYTADVSGFPSGHVIVAAVDTAGNQGGSLPMELYIRDLTPPSVPTGMKHLTLPDGQVILSWTPNPERDIAGYKVYVANDTTHVFTDYGEMVGDTVIVDTLQIAGVNQKYKYYKLKAVDFAGNMSDYTEPYEVMRISYTKPENCVPDSVWQTQDTLFIDWRCFSANTTKEYRLYRRLEGSRDWTLVQVVDADDAPRNIVHTYDSPRYNREKRYFYALETMNITGLSSGLEHQVSFWHKGSDEVEVPIELSYGVTKNGRLVLKWEPSGDIPMNYHYVVEVCKEGEDYFHDMQSYRGETTQVQTTLLREGDKARFRVRMRWNDGRYSNYSNEIDVTLTIPRDEEK